MTSPSRVSCPASRMFCPPSAAFLRSKLSPHPEVFSALTTASAPPGAQPPVQDLRASPLPQVRPPARGFPEMEPLAPPRGVLGHPHRVGALGDDAAGKDLDGLALA